MAPCRILTFNLNFSPLYYVSVLLLSITLISGCGTTQKTPGDSNTSPDSESKTDIEAGDAISEEFIALLNTNRSSLSDVFATQNNNVPEFFQKESSSRDIGDPYEGYRIQIVSTRDVAQADSIANDFRFWADSAMTDYVPKAYVLFRQPYYKVHVGNFQFQDHAMKLNEFLKERYPGAWVVHDEVEPNLVPPDTVRFHTNGQ